LSAYLFFAGVLSVSSCAGADFGTVEKPDASETQLTRVQGAELRQLVTGNTIEGVVFIGSNGRHFFADNKFKEYHARDGRVLGFADDGKEIFQNVNTCWEIKGDEVCYTNYSERQGHCSQYFTTNKPNEIRGLATDMQDVVMVGKIVKGNPNRLSDNDVEWKCRKP
jgi:hypothetical protein